MQTLYTITTELNPAECAVTLWLNGKFCEEAIPELEQSISDARGAHQRITIDLSEVTLVDRKAVEYISEQASGDIKLVNCPLYLRRWIKQVSDEA
jgi:anti-anti-sigma regulatory factor